MKFIGFNKRNCFEIEVHAVEVCDERTWEQAKEIEDTPYNRELIETLLLKENKDNYLEIKTKQVEALELLGFNFYFKQEQKEDEHEKVRWKCLDWNRNWINLSYWYIDHIYYYDENTYRYSVQKD